MHPKDLGGYPRMHTTTVTTKDALPPSFAGQVLCFVLPHSRERMAVGTLLKVAWLSSRRHFSFPQGINQNMIWEDGEKSKEQSQDLAGSSHGKSGANFGIYSGAQPRTQVERALVAALEACPAGSALIFTDQLGVYTQHRVHSGC